MNRSGRLAMCLGGLAALALVAGGCGDDGGGEHAPRITPAAAVTAGEDHSLALKTDGTVWAWGWNVDGELGDGTTTDSSTPVQSGL